MSDENFLAPAARHNSTATIHRTPLIRERNLKLAISAIKALDESDMTLIFGVLLDCYSRAQLDRWVGDAERSLRVKPTPKLTGKPPVERSTLSLSLTGTPTSGTVGQRRR